MKLTRVALYHLPTASSSTHVDAGDDDNRGDGFLDWHGQRKLKTLDSEVLGSRSIMHWWIELQTCGGGAIKETGG